ncbi:hypothetical protein DSUL_140022 [Desulfovibrionales bacterium]
MTAKFIPTKIKVSPLGCAKLITKLTKNHSTTTMPSPHRK